MKLGFVILISLGFFFRAAAQDQTSSLHLPVDTLTCLVAYAGAGNPAHGGQELFSRALEWLDTAFRYSSSEIRMADMPAGRIISRQTVQLVISEVSYNLIFTLTLQIRDSSFQYTFTNIYFDRIGPGIPVVRCEDLIHATKQQYGLWTGGCLVIGSVQKVVDKLLAPLDGCMRQMEGSLRGSMMR
jgi:hypothetical protein